jgi:hypothetical protein
MMRSHRFGRYDGASLINHLTADAEALATLSPAARNGDLLKGGSALWRNRHNKKICRDILISDKMVLFLDIFKIIDLTPQSDIDALAGIAPECICRGSEN